MKKVFSLFLIGFLLLVSLSNSVLALEPEEDVVLWSAMSDGQLTDGVTLGIRTSVDNQWVPGTIQDEADWSGKYDMIGALLPEVISNKVVNLSFDYCPEASDWGAPSFRVDVFEQNQAYAEGSDKWYLGFYSYDEPGQNDHVKVNDAYPKYYDDTKSFFTYYGNDNGANSEPYDQAAGEWVNGRATIAFREWNHIDCVYDLVNRKVAFYVDGTLLGTSAGPSAIGALAFRKKNYEDSKSVYFGKARFDNIRLTEVKEGSLDWETQIEQGQDSFLINFSEPVNVLAKGMISLIDMETFATARPASTEKINPYLWRVNINEAKKNAEYKVNITALTSSFGGTAKTSSKFAYTGSAEGFGIKNVRYDAVVSNTTETVVSGHSDEFSAYDSAADPGANKEKTNDYEALSGGLWRRSGHSQSSSWWGQGTYVNEFGQLAIDCYSNADPISVGAVRKINDDGSAVTDGCLSVEFDMAYYVLDRHLGSSFTLYADEYPLFGADQRNVYLFDEQLVDEKISFGNNSSENSSFGKDLKKVKFLFDFDNKKIKVSYDDVVKNARMCEELADAGIANLRFMVNLLNGIEGANGDYRGNAFVMDNYSDKVIACTDTPTVKNEISALEELAPTTSKINITFTDVADAATIGGITIADKENNSVNYTPGFSADGKTLTLTVALKPETDYTLTVPTTVASAAAANEREYVYSFRTDSVVKFFDKDEEEISLETLPQTTFAKVRVLMNSPSDTGNSAYLCVIYDKDTDVVKDICIQESPNRAGGVVAYEDGVKIQNDEYAKIFLWDSFGGIVPITKNYTLGK